MSLLTDLADLIVIRRTAQRGDGQDKSFNPTLDRLLLLCGIYENASSGGGGGSGDVSGPASSVNNEVPLFSGTTGKLLKRATGTGWLRIVNGVLAVVNPDPQSLAGSGSIDWDATNRPNAHLTMTGDCELQVPDGLTEGMSGFICGTQDATGGRALDLASGWNLTTGNLADVAAMAGGKRYILSYVVNQDVEVFSTLIFEP